MAEINAVIRQIRKHRALTITDAAKRSHTSRPTFSDYEHAKKTPNTATLERIAEALDAELTLTPRINFVTFHGFGGKPFYVPSDLPALSPENAFREVHLPIHLAWSGQRQRRNLQDRTDRRTIYERVLEDGRPEDILSIVDGNLLVDLWDDLLLSPVVENAWAPLIERVRNSSGQSTTA